MRIGIFGDVHGNRQALDAVFEALDAASVDQVVCLGDLVGYGADAAYCLRQVRSREIPVVAGNHDWAVAGRMDEAFFNHHALAAVRWTRDQLSDEELAWLAALEPLQVRDGLTYAHGTVHDPDEFDYMTAGYDAFRSFQVMATDVGFVGHSHVPMTFFFDGTAVTYSRDELIEVGERRVIANPGSVGQPRDDDPRASFLVYDTEHRTLQLRRVSYDIEAAAAKIIDAGLPELLAERLFVGR